MPKSTRMTKQKQLILDILRGTKSHPTADWVYEQARKVIPEISLGTVYRNLNVLKENKEIMELNYGSTFSRFDGNSENHYHFVCENCGRVDDVDLPPQEEVNRLVTKVHGGEVAYHRLEFYGTCAECQKGNSYSGGGH